MDGRRAVPAERREVYGRPVAAVPVEAVIRKETVEEVHESVPCHLRDDRRGRDRGHSLVPPDVAALLDPDPGQMNRVEEKEVRLDAGFAEVLERPPHGELVGPGDPQGVDLGGRREPDGDAPRASPDPSVERLADHGRQPLGVIEAKDLGLGFEDDRARVDGTGEASSPHLV